MMEELGELSVGELATRRAQMKAIEERAKALGKQINILLEERMGDNDSVTAIVGTTPIGKVAKTKASAGRGLKVKDKYAYGAWLAAHAEWLGENGFDSDSVYAVPCPKETAMSAAFLRRLNEHFTSDQIDGVEFDGGRPAQIRCTLEPDVKAMFTRSELPEARLLLDAGGEL